MMMLNLFGGVSQVAVTAALAAAALLWAYEARLAARWIRRDDAFGAGAVALLIAAAWALSSGTSLRGGHNNEHDFLFLATSWFPPGPKGLAGLFVEVDKELSPVSLLALSDLVSGRSLDGFLAMQKVLWLANGFLAYALLRLLRTPVTGAAAGAALLSLNFLAILNTYAFSRINANVFFALLGMASLASLLRSERPEEFARRWACFLACAYLSLTSRFEFCAILFAGLVIGAAFNGAGWLRRVARPALVPAACSLAAFALAFAAWLPFLVAYANVVWDGFTPWRNMAHHLGARHLTLLTGLAPAWGAAAGVLLILSGAWRGPHFAGAFLALWAAAFAVVYYTPGYYVLHVIRHHLYFYLPFALLGGRLLSFSPRRWALLAAGLAAAGYLALNLAVVSRHQADLRTNDREWQFLVSARRDWPAGCAAVYPFSYRIDGGDSRGALLAKYFPGPGKDSLCVLLYRSPRTQVMDYASPMYRPYDEAIETLYGKPWRESAFHHRFYTDWHGPWSRYKAERLERVVVRAGFYEPSPAGRAVLAAAGGGPLPGLRDSRLLADIFPATFEPEDYRPSVEGCFSSGSAARVDPFEWGQEAAPSQALRCFDAALVRENRPAARAELLFGRADAYAALGRRAEARRDLRRAIDAAGPRWGRLPAARRRLAEAR